MKAVKLVDLLKLNSCQKCCVAFKRKKDRKLMCGWECEDNEATPCIKVLDCGSWPGHFNDELFEQIKVPQ